MAVDITTIKIDAEALTLGDVEILMDRSQGGFTQKLEVLERVCKNVDVRKIPLVKLQEVIEMIDVELEKVVNPTSAG